MKTNYISLSNILPNIDIFSKGNQHIPMAVVRQKCQQIINYWHQQETTAFIKAVFHLEQIVQVSPQYYEIIIKFLSEFVQNHSPYISQSEINTSPRLTTEIQAALTVIGRIHHPQPGENELLDLSNTDLQGANLQHAHLEGTNLYHVNLAGANLSHADLSGTILSAANLSGANLSYANLSGAILSAANFSQANLRGANLSAANLYLANLHQAHLDDVIWDGANLREIKGKSIRSEFV